MNAEYTAVLKQDGEWWIGWIQEVPGVNCQERTKADLLISLKEILSEAIEFNRQEEVCEIKRQIHCALLLPHTRLPNLLAQAYRLGRDLHEIVIADVFEGVFEGHLFDRR